MNRGLTKEIRALIASGQVDSIFTAEWIQNELPNADLKGITNSLSRMARLGELKSLGSRSDRSYQIVEPSTPEALENLLDAITEAEPVLRKAIKIMKLMQEVNEDA